MGDAKGGPVYRGLGKIPDRLLFLFAGLVYLFLYAPIMVLIFFSFNSTRSTQVWTGFSTEWYGELIRDQSILDAFRVVDDKVVMVVRHSSLADAFEATGLTEADLYQA